MSMRIRQVKPSFWSDPLVSALPEATRLFYIGCWMEADDAGWLKLDAAEVAHDLYGYENRARRERRVAAMFAELVAAGRIVQHPCGHSEIPTLSEHQHLASSTRQVRTVLNEHMKRCVAGHPQIPADPRGSARGDGFPQTPAETRGAPQVPALVRSVKERVEERSGTVRSGSGSAGADTTGEESEFRRLVPVELALGVKVS